MTESGTKKKRTGEPNKGIAREHKRRKRVAAEGRQEWCQSLSLQERLQEISKRRGGSARETQRIIGRIKI